MSKEERFKDPKKSKLSVVPSPSANCLRDTCGKREKKANSKNIMDMITKGVARSIYYN